MSKTVAAVVKLIDQFTSPSKQVITAAKNVEKRFQETADKFEAVGAVFSSVGETMSKAVTVPLTAAGTAAIHFADESQSAFNQFAAATGTATEEMGKYQDIINDVYKDNFGESMNDVADAMAKVKQNMSYLQDGTLGAITEYAITLSDTMGYDVAESTRAADTLIKNFGVSANEAFNLIAQGSQNGLDFSGEMMDSINEYSVQFGKLGMDAEDMFNIMAAGAQNGAFNLDKIGDAVKEFSIRAIDGSDTTIAGFEALGLNADAMAAKFAAGGDGAKEAFDQVIQGLAAMKDPVAQSAAGVNLFGTMWEDLGPSVVTSLAGVEESFDKTKDSMMEMVNVKYDSLSSALGGLWRTIQVDVLQPIGNMLIPYVTEAIDKIGELVDWWNDLEPATQKNIVKFAGIAAAIGPALLTIEKLHKGIGGTIETFGEAAGAIKTMSSSIKAAGGIIKILTRPTNIAVIAVAAFAAAAILVYKNWDKIKAFLVTVGKAIAGFGKDVSKWFSKVCDSASELWESIKVAFGKVIDKINNVIDAAITKMGEIIGFIGDIFKTGFQTALDAVQDYFGTWYDGIKKVINNVKGVLDGIVDFINNIFSGNWSAAWESLKSIVANAFGALEGLVKTPINAVINLVNKAIGAINEISIDLPDFAGGGHLGFNIPTIPTLAKGTDNWKGGIVQISEQGGEIVDLPSGTRVYPHDESVRMAREEGKGKISVAIAKLADQIIVREDADIDRIAEAVARKIVEVSANMA